MDRTTEQLREEYLRLRRAGHAHTAEVMWPITDELDERYELGDEAANTDDLEDLI